MRLDIRESVGGGLDVTVGVAVERLEAALERVEGRRGEAPQVADGEHGG